MNYVRDVKNASRTEFPRTKCTEPFRESYFKYNKIEKHKCVDGVYEDFCCGSVYKSNDIFVDPLTLQIQLGIDDFEVCCALKSKANIHKCCATYMQIKNMSIEFRSKLDTIHLVALCETSNMKSDDTTYNHIAKQITDEFKILETNGLNVSGRVIRASLVNIACDNLGASTVFGFTECFVAT